MSALSLRVCAAAVAPVLAMSAAVALTTTSPAQATSASVGAVSSATIAQIQGRSHISPYKGKRVNGVRGVVTVIGPMGYWVQSQTPDDDAATSEGLFVLADRAAVTVAVGDDLSMEGSVSEFR